MCTEALTCTHTDTVVVVPRCPGLRGPRLQSRPRFATDHPWVGFDQHSSAILCKLGQRTPNMRASTYRRWSIALQPSGSCTSLHTRRAHRALSASSGWLPCLEGATGPLLDSSRLPGLKSFCSSPKAGRRAELSYSLLICSVQNLKS